VALAIGWRATGAAVTESLRLGGTEVRVLGDAASPADSSAPSKPERTRG